MPVEPPEPPLLPPDEPPELLDEEDPLDEELLFLAVLPGVGVGVGL
jgi:hypothetical protein